MLYLVHNFFDVLSPFQIFILPKRDFLSRIIKERRIIRMKGRELNQSRNKLRTLLWMVMAACLILTGCASFGPISLNKAVIQYDDTVLRTEQQVLLLNIIRMHDDQPPHFTVTSSISATFDFSSTAGINSSFSNSSNKNTLGLTLGATVKESPTITITPLQGKEFAQRLLQPIDAKFVNTILLQQGGPMLDKMLRLIGSDFLMIGPKNAETIFKMLKDSKGEEVEYNYPFPNLNDLTDKDKGGFKEKEARCLLNDYCYIENRPPKIPSRGDIQYYELFRKVVLHIRAMALSGLLYISPLVFDVPNDGIEGTLRTTSELKNINIKDTTDELEQQYHWRKEVPNSATREDSFKLTKCYSITALTNFDVEKMKDEDKKKLLERIQKDISLKEAIKFEEGMIIVLLRGEQEGDQKNRWPIYGYFSLRNFKQVLQFLAESLNNQPGYAKEYDVAPSRFTEELLKELSGEDKKLQPRPLDNPALTLTINSDSEMTPPPPRDRLVEVDYNGKFWISPPRDQRGIQQLREWDNPHPLRWDGEVFRMLYEIFQFNRTEPVVSTPTISILK
jgi:hypothetical protein